MDLTQNLFAESNDLGQTESELGDAMRIAAQVLLDDVQPQLNLNQGDINMLFMDVPPEMPAQYAPVMVAQASQAQDPAKTDRTIVVCQLVNSFDLSGSDDPLSPIYVISPVGNVSDYINMFEKRYVGLEGKVTLLQAPAHGELKVTVSGNYRYTPVVDYIGSDRATFLVEIGGLKVKAVYHFKVIDGGAIGGTEWDDKKNCPKGYLWKISTTSDANGNLIVTSVDYQSPLTDAGTFATDTATLSFSALNSLAVDPSAITLNLADLPNGAVRQTTGINIKSGTGPMLFANRGQTTFIAAPWYGFIACASNSRLRV